MRTTNLVDAATFGYASAPLGGSHKVRVTGRNIAAERILMSLSRCLALLAVGCLACGCSEPRSNPRPRSQARNLRPVAAQQVARRSDAASSTDVGKVITVSHVAPEKDLAPPVVNIPLLIEEEADLLSDAVAAGGCDALRSSRHRTPVGFAVGATLPCGARCRIPGTLTGTTPSRSVIYAQHQPLP